MTEVRTQPLAGTRYVKHSLVIDGVIAHEQLSPYSDAAIEARTRSHLRPEPESAMRLAEFVPGSRGTAKSYGAKGGRAGPGRRAKASIPEDDE